jgi:Uma2 family endonuclease
MRKERPMTNLVQQQTHTPPESQPGVSFAEWTRLLSAGRYEVTDGEVIELSPPNARHVRLARMLFRSLDAHVQASDLGEVWLEAPYLLEADERTNWVYGSKLPDVSFISRERYDTHLSEHGEDGPYRLAPDLVIEIVSPTDSYTEVNEKIANYLRHGVRLAIVVDARQRAIRTHTPDNPDPRTLYDGDILATDPVIPGWSAPVSDILGPKPAEPTV